MESDRYIFVLDGITLQHVGELLFNTSITTDYRKKCFHTYLQCIEDFSFSIFYGDSFGHTGSFTPLIDQEPAELLCNSFISVFQNLSFVKNRTQDELLFDINIREMLAIDFANIFIAINRQREYWEHWMIRETQAYFGCHPSVFKANLDPELYKFDRKPEYYLDRELQDSIDPKAINFLTNFLIKSIPNKKVKKDAIIEFIKRNILTHQLTFYWMENLVNEHLKEHLIHIPHITRNLIQIVQINNSSSPYIQFIKDILTKHVLNDALNYSDNRRENLINRLLVLRDCKPYPDLRKMFSELISIKDQIKQKDRAIKLIDNIRKTSIKSDGFLDKVKFTISLPYAITPGIEIDGSIFKTRKKNALRQIHVDKENKDYLKNIFKVFPELK
jgi:hypothetical protein